MPMPNRVAMPTDATPPTLEQQRAADAWRCAQGRSQEYANLAKSLPALIMNSGLLQVMAFLNEKGANKESQRHCSELGSDLRRWVYKRFQKEVPEDFNGFMQTLINADSRKFQMVTTECLAWLRWLRQFAAAGNTSER
jgi:CRISPR-associated protein Cmr5